MGQQWDAVVIGAGIIGLAVGRELARRGARTVILDERMAGSGATQASAGVLAPYIEAPDSGVLHELTVRSLHLYDRFIEAVRQDSAMPIEYRRGGTLEVADCPAAGDRLMAVAASLRLAGLDARWVDGPEAVRLEPALAQPEGALLLETQGYVRVAQLMAALRGAAQRHGATVLEHRKVGDVAARSDGLVVTAAGETHSCTTVVVAAGSWSALVAAGPAVSPIRGQLLQLLWNGPPVTRVLWSDRCYVVPWLDGTVLVGATVENVGFDQRTTVAGVRELADAACCLMPSAREATFVEARAGLRPSTADGVPLIGRSPRHPGIVYATGHYRNGVLLAPLTADLIADLVIDNHEDPVLALTAPGR